MSAATANGWKGMSFEADPWTGLILAGGQSSRMGQDKARLPWPGADSLLDYMIGFLSDCGCRQVLVSGNYPEHQGIPDRRAGLGPLGGLDAVLASGQVACPWLLMVPIDMPLLEQNSLQTLMATAQQQGRGARFQASPLPMVLKVDPALGHAAEAAIDQGGAMHQLGRMLELVQVANPGSNVLDNLNTPEAMNQALRGRENKT